MVDDAGQTDGPPSFESPPGFPATGGLPPSPPPSLPPSPSPASGLPPASPAPPEPDPAGRPGRRGSIREVWSPGPGDGDRPVPTLASMLAVGAGLLVAAGLLFLLDELDSDQRTTGIVISLLFLALGVTLSVVNRSSRVATAGVAISLVAVAPLAVYLFATQSFFDDLNGTDANPFDGIRGTVNLMLVTATVLWLAGYLLGPGRRYGVYLGAALLALWTIPMFNIQVSAAETAFAPFQDITVTPIPSDPGFDDPSFGDPSNSQFDEDFTFEEPELTDPSTKLGVVSLAFGAAYLLGAAWRDRRGDRRMATAFLAPALIVLIEAVALLSGHVGWVGWGVLTTATGGAILAVGLRGGRRASSWIGIGLATLGFGSLVAEGLSDSPRAIGGALTLIGVVAVLAIGRFAGAPSAPAPDAGLADPPPAEPPAGPPMTGGSWAPPTGEGSATPTSF